METFESILNNQKQSRKDIHFIFDVPWIDHRLEIHGIANGVVNSEVSDWL